jgi:hypothetical protein
MAINRPCYATREQVKRALDVHETARNNAQVDRAIESASDEIDGGMDGANRGAGCLHRRFVPEDKTRYFDWPADSRLWLDQHELAAATEIVAGGETIALGDYLLRPDDGPPYTHVEINLGSQAAFNAGDTTQRAIAITGTWMGCAPVTAPAGELAGAVNDTVTTINLTDSAAMGVGDIIIAGTERMLVTDRRMLDAGQNLQANLTATNNDTLVEIEDGAAYTVDEVILLDAERMLIVDIAGNNLIVKRAWDGSVLAAHTAGAGIYTPRTLVVRRGALGTAAAAHADATSLVRHVPPALVRDLALAEAVNQLLQEAGAYARTVGSGDNERQMTMSALNDLRDRAYTAYGRKARTRAV